MQIEFTGRHTEVTPALRKLAERKITKLTKVLPGITRVHVILTADKHRQIAEVTVHSGHLDLAALEESGDLAASLSTVIEKLTRQAQKHVGRVRQRKRRTARGEPLWSGVLAAIPVGDGGGNRVVQSRRFVPKPMTVDEAVLEVDATDEGLLVFRDAATEKLSVLYRRKDGGLGLIEPEA